MDVESGSLSKPTSTGTQTVSLVDTGLTAKLVILWSTASTSNGSLQSDFIYMWGWSDGTTDYGCAGFSEDGVTTSNCASRHAPSVFTEYTSGGALNEANLDSFSAGEFVLDWTTVDSIAYTIHYLVIGGSDIDVELTSFTAATSTGNQTKTGLSIQPDVVFFATAGDSNNASGPGASGVNFTDSSLAFGVMVADGGQEGNTICGDDANSGGDTSHSLTAGFRAFRSFAVKSGTPQASGEFSFVSMNSDGWTVIWNVAAGAAFYISALAISGGSWEVANESAPASATTKSITVGFQPKGAIFYVGGESNSPTNYAAIGHGVATDDGGSSPFPEGSWAGSDDDAAGTTDANRITQTDKAVTIVDESGSIVEAADLDSWDSGGVTLDWTTVSGAETLFGALLFGDAVEEEPGVDVPPQPGIASAGRVSESSPIDPIRRTRPGSGADPNDGAAVRSLLATRRSLRQRIRL